MASAAFRTLFENAPASLALLRDAAHAPPVDERALAIALFGPTGARALTAPSSAAFLVFVAEVGARTVARLVACDNFVRYIVRRNAALDGTLVVPLVIAGPMPPDVAGRALLLCPTPVTNVAASAAEFAVAFAACGILHWVAEAEA